MNISTLHFVTRNRWVINKLKLGVKHALMDTTFTLDDFLGAMDQMQRMGPIKSLMKLVPGMPVGDEDPDQDVRFVRAMIQSMTPDERRDPDHIEVSRRNRIARGSGTSPDDVGDLIRQFQVTQRMMARMSRGT